MAERAAVGVDHHVNVTLRPLDLLDSPRCATGRNLAGQHDDGWTHAGTSRRRYAADDLAESQPHQGTASTSGRNVGDTLSMSISPVRCSSAIQARSSRSSATTEAG